MDVVTTHFFSVAGSVDGLASCLFSIQTMAAITIPATKTTTYFFTSDILKFRLTLFKTYFADAVVIEISHVNSTLRIYSQPRGKIEF